MKRGQVCASIIIAFVVLALLSLLPINLFDVPEAQAATYSYDDSTQTVTISGSGTVYWATLRTQDTIATKSHALTRDFYNSSALPMVLDYVVRPLDSLEIRLKIEVRNCFSAGSMEILGYDYEGTANDEIISISANTTYTTTYYYKTVNLLDVVSTGNYEFKVFQDRWGIFGYNVGYPSVAQDYILQGGIIIGSGITFQPAASPLWYKLTMRIATGDLSILEPAAYITVNSGGTCNFGSVISSTLKTVQRGTQITIQTDIGESYYEIFNNGGTLNFYGSSISSNSFKIYSAAGSTTRLWGAQIISTPISGSGWDISNVVVSGGTYFIDQAVYPFSGTVNRLTILGQLSPIIIYSTMGNVTFTLNNLYARGVSYLVYDMMQNQYYNGTIYFVNTDSDSWATFTYSKWSGKFWRQYTFALNLTSNSNAPIENANVTVSYFGQGGGTAFSVLTGTNGSFAEQTLTMGFYNYTGGTTLYSYNPYKLKITHNDYQTVEMNFTLSDKIDWGMNLELNPQGGSAGAGTPGMIPIFQKWLQDAAGQVSSVVMPIITDRTNQTIIVVASCIIILAIIVKSVMPKKEKQKEQRR